jgi:glycerol-3-phosphate acyltransferase PlsY
MLVGTYMTWEFLLIAMLAYLLGSIPSGKLIAGLYGVDIQKKGSGNIGFANVLRVLGWKRAVVVLLVDIAKGFLPVVLAISNLSAAQVEIVAVLVLAGNVWPVWLNFKGGKGIATGLGVTLALSPVLAGLCALVYLISVAIFKKSAPSSLLAAAAAPFFCLITARQYVYFYILAAVFAAWTHRANIRELLGFNHAA